MTETKFFPRRLLWVDAQPSTLDHAGRFLRAHHLDLRFVDSFEKALVEMDTWSPHLLLLDYTSGAMAYATFVYAQLPLVDPYRATGCLENNPWRHTACPILLTADEPTTSTPGLIAPHLARVAHFMPKPVEPSCLISLVDKWLPETHPGIVLDPDHGQVEVQGCRHTVSEQRMDLLVTLARHHPRPLTAARLAQRMHKERGVLTSESAVRMTVSALRRQLVVDDPRSLIANKCGYFLTCTPTLLSD